METLIELFGKFHPLLLHLPIGILVYAYLHLGFNLFIKKKQNATDFSFALGIGALFAVLSSISGYFLSINGEYSGDLLDWHKWLGIGVAVGSILLFILYTKVKSQTSFFGLFTLFIILLSVTGHYGGSLTHGEGFLSLSDKKTEEPNAIEDITKAHVFNDLVMPIVDRKCMSCHNPKKKKGELLLNTLEGWKNGGKSGPFVIPGNIEESSMLTRIHLPTSDKEHMPPSGKLQLEKEEVKFIEWWIRSMKDYENVVSELDLPAYIKKFIDNKLDLSTRNVPPVKKEEIITLQQDGLPVQLMNAGKPWLSVVYSGGKKVNKKDLNKLSKYKENIRELKLNKTGVTDKLLSSINEFINLKTLDLSQNEVSSKGIKKLEDLVNLESLNLYKTNVDTDIIEHLTYFPKLSDIYLWQTKVNKTDIENKEIADGLNINLGQSLDVFGKVQLSPPTIESKLQIFKDTISVVLTHVAKNAKIYYTLNGDDPTSKATLYNKPLTIDKTAELKVIAEMNQWENSRVVSKSFLKSNLIPADCEITPNANEKYKGDGNITLINGIKGTDQFADGKWLGFSGEDVSITLDLGEEKMLNSISFGALRDYRSYIFTPIGSVVSSSIDGESYSKIKEESYPQITKPEDNLVKDYIVSFSEVKLRYLKLELTAQKKNPSWHADPGADCWLFLDEIVLE